MEPLRIGTAGARANGQSRINLVNLSSAPLIGYTDAEQDAAL
ncbi:hypothetical protein [Eikenella sp. NML03-A-027]|nr:hypothetical protein [Eikenella sp. NML03-A-027]